MTTVDIFGIKQRIVTILKAQSSLFSTQPSDKTKFRKIEAGSPSPKAIQEPPLPRCWVTSDDTVAIVKPLGVIANNISQGEEYDVRIKIIFATEAKDGPSTEEKIDDFIKTIINTLEVNYDLRSGAESTRVAESSEVLAIKELPSYLKGDRVRGRAILFRVIVRA